jgi:hypothetical protein
MDYSIMELNKLLFKRFGKNGHQLQKDEHFNIWEAYTYLKKYTGILDDWFSQKEYEKRIKNIQEVLNV